MCTSPVDAYWSAARNENGRRFPVFNKADGMTDRPFKLKCNNCTECRIQYAQSWAVRVMNEKQLHQHSTYITLTYENLPDNQSLNHRHYQLFMKRLRKQHGAGIKFFMCGEYGDNTDRPHYHAILFGLDFNDRKRWKKNKQGDDLYISQKLDNLWQLGHCSLGAVTYQSAAYVSRYVTKKITGKDAAAKYGIRQAPYCRPSTGSRSGKGIGYNWWQKYRDEAIRNRGIVMDGKLRPIPRYYLKLLETEDPQLAAKLRNERIVESQPHRDDEPGRLLTKHTVHLLNEARYERDLS